MTDLPNLDGAVDLNEVQTPRGPCNAPGPLVVNGAGMVGCILPEGHDGLHSVTVAWERS